MYVEIKSAEVFKEVRMDSSHDKTIYFLTSF